MLYRERNCIKSSSTRSKHRRRIVTRYEKHASNFLAMLKLAAVRLRLRHYEFHDLVKELKFITL